MEKIRGEQRNKKILWELCRIVQSLYSICMVYCWVHNIPELQRQRHEDQKFEDNLGYIWRPSPKTKTKVKLLSGIVFS